MRVKKRCKVVPMPRIEIINTLHVPYHTLLHAVTSRYMPQYTRKSNFLTTTEGGRSTSGQSSPPTHQGGITRRQTQALQTHYIYNARTFPNPPYLTSTAQHGKNPAGWLEPQGWCSQSWHHHQGRQYSCWSLQLTGGAGISSQLMGQAPAGSVPSICHQKKTPLPKAGSSNP